ncbi:MAG: flagellar motor switch protein FliG [Nitrospirae bacterium]|nr:flagellar motor switch protein FliG [Nitrospirota bacterium]
MEKLSGYEKAAILLVSVGEEVASEVMKHLDAREIRHIGGYLSKATKIEPDSVRNVMREFHTMASSPEGFVFGGEEYVRSVLTRAMGADKATKVMENLALGSDDKGLEALKWIDPRGIANFIRLEHPQTIALILSHLDPDQVGQVIGLLPEGIRADICLRMATLEGVPSTVVKEIEEALNKQLQSVGTVMNAQLGGPEVVAQVLNMMDHSNESLIMAKIEQASPELAEKIRQKMFIFEDLVTIDDRGVQELLKEINKEDLVLAMKAAGEDLKAKIFKNMSERAAQNLRDDLEAKGPVRLSEVEKSQQTILKTAKRLEEEGRLILGGKGAEELVV